MELIQNSMHGEHCLREEVTKYGVYPEAQQNASRQACMKNGEKQIVIVNKESSDKGNKVCNLKAFIVCCYIPLASSLKLTIFTLIVAPQSVIFAASFCAAFSSSGSATSTWSCGDQYHSSALFIYLKELMFSRSPFHSIYIPQFSTTAIKNKQSLLNVGSSYEKQSNRAQMKN